MNSMELSNYLEKIRFGRNMSQEEFVSGIVSIRQYQRYKNGDSVVPYEKIGQFAEKLGISSKKLLTELERAKDIQYQKINNFYNAVANNDYKIALTLKKELDSDLIISEEGRMYYKHSNIVFRYYSREISLEEVIRLDSELINYPEVLKQKYYTDVEVLVLSFLLSVLTGKQQDMLLNRLNLIFESEDSIMAGGADYVYNLILMRIARTYGVRRDYPRVIYYCQLGIDRGIDQKQYYLWDYFFYFKSLAHHALGQTEEFDDSILRCFNVLQMEGNHAKIEKFTTLIEKDFDINFKKYVISLIDR